MALYRDEGVVLRTQKLGEADRIITVLTRRHGRIRAVAKGVRRTSSRFGARLEPFTQVDAQLHVGRSLDVVTQVETLTPFGERIHPHYAAYTAGQAILEAAERFTAEEREPALRLYLLLLGALGALAGGEHTPGLVLDAFLLRALVIAGYEPALSQCARCGAPGPHAGFAPAAGGVVCAADRPPGSASPAPETVELLVALRDGDWGRADAANRWQRREASGLVAALLHWHLERGLRALAHVERV